MTKHVVLRGSVALVFVLLGVVAGSAAAQSSAPFDTIRLDLGYANIGIPHDPASDMTDGEGTVLVRGDKGARAQGAVLGVTVRWWQFVAATGELGIGGYYDAQDHDVTIYSATASVGVLTPNLPLEAAADGMHLTLGASLGVTAASASYEGGGSEIVTCVGSACSGNKIDVPLSTYNPFVEASAQFYFAHYGNYSPGFALSYRRYLADVDYQHGILVTFTSKFDQD